MIRLSLPNLAEQHDLDEGRKNYYSGRQDNLSPTYWKILGTVAQVGDKLEDHLYTM